jgi:hypothetical protein
MKRESCSGKRHLLFCVADHFEPFDRTIMPDGRITGGVSDSDALRLVKEWCTEYRDALGEFRDADGMPPRHTFFYPWDEYDEGCVENLASFCRAGYGEVEIHLHHRNDSEKGVRQKLIACRDTYAEQHGLLGVRGRGSEVGGEGVKPVYAFVHGNWCLCNARSDGDWCGVERELAILADTGCYADLTFPSAPSDTQPRSVNEIYYGRDPRAGERGVQVGRRLKAENGNDRTSGREKCDQGAGRVMMIPGPLGLNWNSRKYGVLPRLENGEVSGANPATGKRLRLWGRIGVHVKGRPDWVVVKLHTHGAVPGNRKVLTGADMISFHRELAQMCSNDGMNDGSEWVLHYVSARELYNIARAAEVGLTGDPGQYRNREVTIGFQS